VTDVQMALAGGASGCADRDRARTAQPGRHLVEADLALLDERADAGAGEAVLVGLADRDDVLRGRDGEGAHEPALPIAAEIEDEPGLGRRQPTLGWREFR
jgi:hypothetical protein